MAARAYVSEEDVWIRTEDDVWMCVRCGFEEYGPEPHDCAADAVELESPPLRLERLH